MEKHLHIGSATAIVTAIAMMIVNVMAFAGKDAAASITCIVLTPLSWFLDLFDISGYAILDNFVYILISTVIYYFVIGFFIGFIPSILFDAICRSRKGKNE